MRPGRSVIGEENFLTALKWAAMVQTSEHFSKSECAFT